MPAMHMNHACYPSTDLSSHLQKRWTYSTYCFWEVKSNETVMIIYTNSYTGEHLFPTSVPYSLQI